MDREELLFTRQTAVATEEVRSEIAAARSRILAEIERLDLWRTIAELDAKGFAVIPPEMAAPPAFSAPLRDALLEVAARDSGVMPDVEKGTTHENILSRHGNVELIEPLLQRHPIFSDAMLNERLLAVVTYLLGESCVLLSNTGQIKGPGKHSLPLHADQGLTGGSTSFSPRANVCNAVWVLSDYTAENGATCFVPGSHRLCRHPTEAEVRDRSLYEPLEVKSGSILFWHGNTWHGSLPKRSPGLRLGIIYLFARWYLHRGDFFGKMFSREEIAQRPPRFARLIRAAPTSGSDETTIPPAAIFSEFG